MTAPKRYARVPAAPHLDLRVRKLIVEPLVADGWRSMDDDGNVREHDTAADVVRFARARDAKAARAGESTATVVEWRNVPDGFEVPA